jgi:ribosomal protein L1
MKHGKNYRNLRAQIDRENLYSPAEAVRLLKGGETAKFDETVEAHFNLGLNVRHAEQQLRGTLMLPNGTGREARVAVFADGEKAREAEEAGADVVGTNDLAAQIEDGFRRLRRRRRHAGPDERRRQARPHPRSTREDAEPEDGHGHDGRRQGRARGEGG